jgi:hypothetical protein
MGGTEMKSTEKIECQISCVTHGQQPATFVCQHIVLGLKDGNPRGFNILDSESEDAYPDACCHECLALVKRDNGWTAESEAFAYVNATCCKYYENAKLVNDKIEN